MELYRAIEGDGPLVVLVHGFTQTSASWAPTATDLAVDHEVVLVDAPGHGGSADIHADLATGARWLGDAGGRATYVGYSMGGRLALRLALDRPDLVERLVLLGATAGIDDAGDRTARREADDALASRLESDGVEAFLDRWLAQPLFADLTPTADDLAARRSNTVAGLAASLRLAGTGTMDPPWWDELTAIDSRTLVVAGSEDATFTELGHRLVAAIGPNASFAPISASGHAAHLQRPTAFAALVRHFVASTRPTG